MLAEIDDGLLRILTVRHRAHGSGGRSPVTYADKGYTGSALTQDELVALHRLTIRAAALSG
jgi:hypothetical protein